MKTRQLRSSIGGRILTWAGLLIILAASARAQYTANYQTNIISGVTSNWSGNYLVGSNTFADVLQVQNSGVLSNSWGYLGYEASSSNNTALVVGNGLDYSTTWLMGSALTIGRDGSGNSLVISNHGRVRSGVFDFTVNDGYIGRNITATGNSVLVTGPGSVWHNSETGGYANVTVGYSGAGNSLMISNGGGVLSADGYVGYQSSGSNNSVLVTGSGSVWSNSGTLTIGYSGASNSLFIGDGGVVPGFKASCGFVGYQSSSSNNSVLVTGAGSVWSNSGTLTIGYSGASNIFEISNGGKMVNGGSYSFVGYNSSSSNNSMVVTDTGSVWSNRYVLYYGYNGGGNRLRIDNGGQVVAVHSSLGHQSTSSNNNAVVTGSGSVWNSSGMLRIGYVGSGNSLVISNGGLVVNNTAYVGYFSSCSSNSLLITGSGSVWSNSAPGAAYIGYSGWGNSLTITSSGQVFSAGPIHVGYSGSSSNNSVLVNGSGSVWSTDPDLFGIDDFFDLAVGYSGAGNKLVISNGGQVVNSVGYVGKNGGSTNNSVLVTGSGSAWTNRSDLIIGADGARSSLVIRDGGTVLSGNGGIGIPLTNGNDNSVLVANLGSVWSNSLDLYVGYCRGNSLVISNGGKVFNGRGSVGSFSSSASNNTVLVSGPGSVWVNRNDLCVGEDGARNSLVISGSGTAYSVEAGIGSNTTATGNSVVVSGSGSVWSNHTRLFVGWSGADNSLVVSNGGRAITKYNPFANSGCLLGFNSGSTNNRILVSGTGSYWGEVSLTVGYSGAGNSFVVSNGAQAANISGRLGYNSSSSNNSVMVAGPGSTWSSGALTIGYSGTGNSLVISDGGQVLNTGGYVSYLGYNLTSSNNTARVTDGGVWRNDMLHVGEQGSSNSLVIAGGSVLATNLTIGVASANCNNLVQLDSGSLVVTNAVAGAVLEVRKGKFVLNGGLLQVDRFVMTNACAQFARSGGTLIYTTALLTPTRDDDGDGMLNGWEQGYELDPLNFADANADPDGDGFTNLQEFQAGTDPTNSASAFRITDIAKADDDILVTWMMGSGKTNALEATAGDASGGFTNTFANVFTVTNTVGTETNYLDTGGATNSPSRFYRIRLVP